MAVIPICFHHFQHRDCLGSHFTGSYSKYCLLLEKPDGCPQESFDKIHEVFTGDVCEGQLPILGGPDSLPPAYLSVDGWRSCLKAFQASDSHKEKCLPEVQPEECTEEAFNQLQEIIFKDTVDPRPDGESWHSFLIANNISSCQ